MNEADRTKESGLPLAEQAARLLGELQRERPLVHCITNYVTANDCANILLAIGASPIMADDPEETGEIAAAARALVLNMGTPSRRKLEAMVRAGKRANEAGIPVILDPVGAGASALRREMTERLVREVRVDILRGNVSEVSFAAGLSSREKGVDVSETDRGIIAASSVYDKHELWPTSLGFDLMCRCPELHFVHPGFIPDVPGLMQEAVDAYEKGYLPKDAFITHRFRPEELGKAYELMEQEDETYFKGVLVFD